MSVARMVLLLLLPAAFAAPAGWAGEAVRVAGAVSSFVSGERSAELVAPRLDYSTTRTSLDLRLPPLDNAELGGLERPVARGPLAIGIHREVPRRFRGDLAPELEWTRLADGAIVTSISLSSPAAVSMRVGLVAKLPDGGEIRFFDPTRPDRRFPAVAIDDFFIGADGKPEVLWSPTVEGEAIGVEIMLPSWEAADRFSLTLEKVAHRYRAMSSPNAMPQSLECGSYHIDVQCRRGSFPSGIENSVARIEFETPDGSFYCSGTLLNSRNSSGQSAYFITANHCVNTQSVARTVEARWFFQRRSCGYLDLDQRDFTTHDGADLLATSEDHDSTLLRLKGRLPEGLWASGWDARPVTHPTDVYNISHPQGEVKKYAAGWTRRTIESVALEVEWSEGATERGSSGSGLFRDEYLIGVLVGSLEEGCGVPDYFGSFADFYPKIAKWINTAATERGDANLTRDRSVLVAGVGDFNGDGRDDVLMRRANGTWYYYPMDGRRVLSGAGDANLTRNRSVLVAGVGDFNGDGRDDVLMRRSNGTWYYYPMDGRRVLSGRGDANLTANRSVLVAGVGDFNGDGRDDVLMRRSNGTWYYYPMNGRRVLSGRGDANLTANRSVLVAGVGDFNGDGRDDVLMRRSNGTWYYYPMDGRRVLSGRGDANLTANRSVLVAGVGDFNGDGRDDVLMRRSNGTWYYYPMDGRRVLSGRGDANLTANRSVLVAGVGDFNGDGRDDVLMRRANGTWYYYPMNGRHIL